VILLLWMRPAAASPAASDVAVKPGAFVRTFNGIDHMGGAGRQSVGAVRTFNGVGNGAGSTGRQSVVLVKTFNGVDQEPESVHRQSVAPVRTFNA
jgi:hypothetical protein